MAICKFFQLGTCRKGNSCTFEHVKSGNNSAAAPKYNETSLRNNLTEERPQWKLSVYGPAKEEPNLIVGAAEHEKLLNQTETQVNAIINNPSGAIQHYEKEKSAKSGAFGSSANNTPFAPFTGGGFGSTTTNAFGGSSAFGSSSTATAFGAPAFGSTNTVGGPPAFGSTSAFGGGGFGNKSTFGSGTAPAFGSPSSLGVSSSAPAFGSTSAFGAGSAFGKPSALGSGSAFGQTSSLGNSPAFGQPAALGSGSAFGKPSALGSGSAFGQTSSIGSSAPAFGQSTSFGSLANNNSTTAAPAFGSATAIGTTNTAFGSSNTLNGGAFGQNNVNSGSTFGQQQSQLSIDTKGDPALEAFANSQFTYRHVPEVEPPIELR
ncbi:hypothetical protein G6F37_010820 [Rhizopus arrhizus]|nr:hypothetical protein G6F38_010878 [Rhizopus arrhizus]KAG1152290.1 hypothetical protein G6F37_010820 [Rhizopus arrhizus]